MTPFRLSKLEFEEDDELTYLATVNGNSMCAYVDSGASHIFCSPKAAQHCGLTVHNVDPIKIEIADGGHIECTGHAQARITMQGLISDEIIYIVPLPDDHQVILGRQWLRKHNPDIDWP